MCLENDGYPVSLETRKVYRSLADVDASRAGLLRVVDESGEDYLYPTRWFLHVSVPSTSKKVLARAFRAS